MFYVVIGFFTFIVATGCMFTAIERPIDEDEEDLRFVVRRTNKRVICSVIYSTIEGDKTMVTADSKALARYGVKCGLTNYASAYCVGLLCARRLLQQKEMGDMYKGNQKVDGSYYCVQDDMGDRR